jgi:hypothetical protein
MTPEEQIEALQAHNALLSASMSAASKVRTSAIQTAM